MIRKFTKGHYPHYNLVVGNEPDSDKPQRFVKGLSHASQD